MNRNSAPLRRQRRQRSARPSSTWFSVESRVGDAELRRPVALGEQPRQHAAQRVLLVEEADAADADRVVSARRASRRRCRARRRRRSSVGCRLAAREAQREQPRMRPGRDGRRAGSRRRTPVGGIGEVAGRVALLPAAAREQRARFGVRPRARRVRARRRSAACRGSGAARRACRSFIAGGHGHVWAASRERAEPCTCPRLRRWCPPP